MPKNPRNFIFLIVLLSFFVYFIVNFFKTDEKTMVKRALYAAVLGIEKNDPARYGRVLSQDYMDDSGLRKDDILRYAAGAFRDYKPFKVELKRLEITAKEGETKSDIAFKCLFKKEDDDRIYYDAGKITAWWRKEKSGWKIFKMEYTSAQDMLFLPAVA